MPTILISLLYNHSLFLSNCTILQLWVTVINELCQNYSTGPCCIALAEVKQLAQLHICLFFFRKPVSKPFSQFDSFCTSERDFILSFLSPFPSPSMDPAYMALGLNAKPPIKSEKAHPIKSGRRHKSGCPGECNSNKAFKLKMIFTWRPIWFRRLDYVSVICIE